MLSAQEKQWVAGYRDFVEAGPSQCEAGSSQVSLKDAYRIGQC